MEVIDSLEQSLARLKSLPGETDLTLLIEDWDEGLKLWDKLSKDEILGELRIRLAKYDCKFHFRVFNSDFDLMWYGDIGVLYANTESQTTELLLETDTKRFPGINHLKSLNYAKIEVQKVMFNGNLIGLKFKRLVKGGQI